MENCERPPTPPCPSTGDSARKTPRIGKLFPILAPSLASASVTPTDHPTVPSILVSTAPPVSQGQGSPYVWAEVEGRGRSLVRHSRNSNMKSDDSSRSNSSSSSSRSPTPSDDRYRSEMNLVGKTPSTPVGPILKFTRKHSYVKEKVIVGVRLRPFISEDQRNLDGDSKQAVVSMKKNGSTATVQVQSRTGSMMFDFDYGFSSFEQDGSTQLDLETDQKIVHETLARPLVESMVAGFNCSFFAYGQTGTGKTFSTSGTDENPGVVPRFCRELLQRIDVAGREDTWKLEISYFEIYNEKIYDLLRAENRKKLELRVRQHPEEGPFVENLISVPVFNYGDIEKWLKSGNVVRTKASTARNDGSSRSHAVFSLKLVQVKNVDGRPVLRKSKANFVDLAGSERLDAASSSMSNADRMAETKNINKSLATLAQVIMQLASGKWSHISYRDSVLTHLLQDSLGGNAKTVMLATIAPSLAYVDETLSTLRYAANAYKIFNRAYVNEDPAIALIEQLKTENEALKAQLSNGAATPSSTTALDDERVASMKRRIEELQSALREREAEIEWQKSELATKKLPEVEKQSRALQTDVGEGDRRQEVEPKLLVKSAKPALILLESDPVFSEANLFVIESLSSIVGQSPHFATLNNGTKILDVQSSINWNDNRLVLYPRADADIYVNGRRVLSGPGDVTELLEGDRLVLGARGEYFFRVFIPNGDDVVVDLDGETLRSYYFQAGMEFFKGRAEFQESRTRKLEREKAEIAREAKETLTDMTEQVKTVFRQAQENVRNQANQMAAFNSDLENMGEWSDEFVADLRRAARDVE